MRSNRLSMLVLGLVVPLVLVNAQYLPPTTASSPNSNESSGQGPGGPNSSGDTQSTTSQAVHLPPLLPYEKYIIAHGIMSVIGYIGLLPFGAITARWLRTWSPLWFRLHWIIQWCLAFPIILTAFALGITAVHKNETKSLSDPHMKWGVAIFVLYLVQLSLGGIIHFFKIPALARRGIRAPQNYLHAVLGLFIIGAAFYQVRTGFRVEWPLYTGRGKVKNIANIAWIVALVMIPLSYFSGLIWLPRQWRQEREAAQKQDSSFQAPSEAMSQRNLREATP